MFLHEALINANNTSVGHLEFWALEKGTPTQQKYGENNIIGCFGEAIAAHLMNQKSVIPSKCTAIFNFQEKDGSRKEDKSKFDFTVDIFVMQITCNGGPGAPMATWYGTSYTHTFYDSDGDVYSETYDEDAWPKQFNSCKTDTEWYRFNYEVKTVNPDNAWRNMRMLSEGINQITNRMSLDSENLVGFWLLIKPLT